MVTRLNALRQRYGMDFVIVGGGGVTTADDYFMYYGIKYIEKLPLYSISDMMGIIRKITLEDVNKLFRMIFTKENLIVGTIGKVPDDYDEKIVKIIENFLKNKESRRLRFQ
jgi:hypothetical protein